MKSKPSLRKSIIIQITAVLLVSITFVALASVFMDYTDEAGSKTDTYGHIIKHLSLYAFLLLLVGGNIFFAKQLSDHLANAIQPFLVLFKTPEGDNVYIEPEKQRYAEFAELALAANEIVKKKKAGEQACLESEERYREIVKEKKDAEQACLESEARYREIVEGTDNLVTEVDIEGNFTFVNETSRQVFGLTPAECIGRKAFDFIHEDDRANTEAHFQRWVKEKARSVTFENRQVSQSGDIRDMLWTINLYFDDNGRISSIKSIARDITELKGYRDELEAKVVRRTEALRKANEKLRRANKDLEGEIAQRKRNEIELREYAESQKKLVREVNHRVQNNLTAIIGMLQMELNKLKTKKLFIYLPFLLDPIERIRGLAKVHTLLSRTGWRALLVENLCREVVMATLKGLASTQHVDLQVSASRVRIDSNQAHHLTMVIHELTTNAMKHALKDRQRAIIHIEIEHQNSTTLIRFKDDGPGYPDDILQNRFESSSIGFELIRGFTRQSLGGNVSFTNQDGAVATISFKNDFEHQKEGVVP